MNKILLSFAGTVLFLTSCSEAPKTQPKKEAAKVELADGMSALWKMYQVARSSWSRDAQVLKLNSILLSELPPEPGKAAAWEAIFTSTELGRSRSYTYSVVESTGNLHKGVFAGSEQPWSASPRGNAPFLIAAMKKETAAAYQTALEKGGADYDKKNPGKPVTFLLEKIAKFPNPAWRVIWGESVGTSNFSVMVDASTGEFLERLH